MDIGGVDAILEAARALLRDQPADVRTAISAARSRLGVCINFVPDEYGEREDGHPSGTRMANVAFATSSTTVSSMVGLPGNVVTFTVARPSTEVGAYVSYGIVDQLRLAAQDRWIPPTVRS